MAVITISLPDDERWTPDPLRDRPRKTRSTSQRVPVNRSVGKGAPAAKTQPGHKHNWLVRYDYMQCKSCGLLVDIKKDRGSVDQ